MTELDRDIEAFGELALDRLISRVMLNPVEAPSDFLFTIGIRKLNREEYEGLAIIRDELDRRKSKYLPLLSKVS